MPAHGSANTYGNAGDPPRNAEEEAMASRVEVFLADQTFHSPDNSQVGSVERAHERMRTVKSAIAKIEDVFSGAANIANSVPS
ncbi:hypothetical protein EsH8_VII_000183 [Colletotrichum jinshuiense]